MRNYSKLSEKELLQRLQAGDENAFTEIYNRYWQKLLAIGYYHTNDKQAAEDIVHDVLMSVWSRKKDLQVHSLNTWLGTAVKYAIFKTIARQRKQKQSLTQITTAPISDIEQKLDAKLLEEYLHEAVEQLPEKARLVFLYSRKQQLSIKDIADKLGLSTKAVEYHITRAVRTLKDHLQKIKFYFI